MLLVFFVFQVLFEPTDQVSDILKLFVVEIKPCVSDLNKLFHWFLISIHVYQNEVLRILIAAPKEIVNMI